MASVLITVSDGLLAKITAQWGSQAAWKDWVKETTRAQIVNDRKRAAYATRLAQFEADAAAIDAADSDN